MNIITVQIIRSSLAYASEEMGIALRTSAYSPNIKERMDHSAALFDHDGKLLAQAEHIPVHLGSLPWGLNNMLKYCEKEGIEIEQGSMLLVNNPYIAGTHLNDVTVVRPIFYSNNLIGYAANKAHHADVGGKVPGSISIDAKTIFEEGVIINPVYLMYHDEFVRDVISLFTTNSRTPKERMGDLKAQVAANVTGERRILEIIRKYGLKDFLESNEESFKYSERLMRSKISKLKTGTYTAVDYLEHPNGSDIKLAVSINLLNDAIEIDYSGTAPQISSSLNAVLGVTISGVHYVLRTVTGEDIPLNYGAFKPIKIFVPEGTILNPTFPYAVAGGNVETSQRNADLLYLALSKALPDIIPAASGGSMNNVMMGGLYHQKPWAFYETIGVGLGGRYGLDGVDGVHANMTNTMNTPIEEVERNLPLIITKYEYRVNSSGAGEFRGGCGMIRAYRMLDETTVTVLAERGHHSPWGLNGGKNGVSTKILVYRNEKPKVVPVKVTLYLNKDDVVEIRTAGGGGWKEAQKRDKNRIKEDLENGIITRSYAKKHYKL